MLYADRKFIILANLLMSSLCSAKCRFEFPKLNDSSRLTSDGRPTIVVEFRAHSSCNASSDNLAYYVGKEVNGSAEHHCLIHPINVKCTERCTCPAEGSDLYRLKLAADLANNGTWTWSSIPSSVMEKHSMQILIEGIDASTEETTTKTITVKTQTADALETLLASSSSYDPAEIKTSEGGSDNLYEAAFFLSLPGIILLTFNGVIIVSVISLVIVVMKRRGRRLRLSLQSRDIPLQELQQDRQQRVPPLAQQQRQLPEIPGQQNVPPQFPTPLVLARSGPGGRRYRSQESNFYEIIDDDERSDEGVRASASAPDLRASNQCADYLHPIPSEQEAAEARAKNPHYENRPLYENYFHPWNVETESHQ